MSLLQPLLLTCCVVYSYFLQMTACMHPDWEIWCCNLNLASLRWCLFLIWWSILLSWKVKHSAWILPVLLWSQSSTVASSCMVTSVLLTWSYPWVSWFFAPMLVCAHLLPVCVVCMTLDMLLSSWIHCLHDIHLRGNPSWCAGQLFLVAYSGYLSCLGREIEWFSCSPPSRWLWRNMGVRWWSKNSDGVVVLDGASEFLHEWECSVWTHYVWASSSTFTPSK